MFLSVCCNASLSSQIILICISSLSSYWLMWFVSSVVLSPKHQLFISYIICIVSLTSISLISALNLINSSHLNFFECCFILILLMFPSFSTYWYKISLVFWCRYLVLWMSLFKLSSLYPRDLGMLCYHFHSFQKVCNFLLDFYLCSILIQ